MGAIRRGDGWRRRACWKGAEYAWSIRDVGYDEAFANIVDGAEFIAAGRGAPELLTAAHPAGRSSKPRRTGIPSGRR
jgi:hypothetical protein